MKKSSKIILTSALLLSAFVGGSHLYFSGQDIENKDPTPKGVEESLSNEVSVSSSEQGKRSEGILDLSPNSTVTEGNLGQYKEDASSISTVIDLPSKSGAYSDTVFDSSYELISKETNRSFDNLFNQDGFLDIGSSSNSQDSINTLDKGINYTSSDIVADKSSSAVSENSTSKTRELVAQEENPIGIISEKGTPLVQEENPELVISEKGESTAREELPSLVVSEKGEPLVQDENPALVLSEKGDSLVQEEKSELIVTETGTPEIREDLPDLVISEKGEPLVQEDNPAYVVSEKGESLVQEELPKLVISEKGEPLVQEDNPELIISEKGEPLVQEENPELVISEKGESLIQPEKPVGIVSEKGEPLVQEELPELVISEKGEPLVQEENPELVISEKGTPLVQEENPELVISEKGTPLVQEENPKLVISEKGEPLVQEEFPELVVSEKGEPLVQEDLPELKTTTTIRVDTKVLKPSTVYMEDIKLHKGEKRVSFDGTPGSLTTTYEDLVDQDGNILESKKLNEIRVEPVVKVIRYGVRKQGEQIGEFGLYHLSEHTNDLDIVKFTFNITLSADEIAKLGQDEIEKRSNENIENNLWLASKSGWYTIANAPVSDEVIAKLNTDDYIDHKRIGLESLRLVNEERKRLGKKELVWSDKLYELAQKRAENLSLNGNIRYWTPDGTMLKHVWDDKGTSWTVVAKGTDYEIRGKGENLAGHTLPRNVYQLFNEKLIAQRFFDLWMKSPGHYANMTADGYTEFAFDLSYSDFWRNDALSKDYLAQSIQGVQLFAV